MAGFPWVYVCDLLEALESLEVRLMLPGRVKRAAEETTITWFAHHADLLNNCDHIRGDTVAKILRPELFNESRCYGLDAGILEQITRRVFSIPNRHLQELQKWRHNPQYNFGSCVQKVMQIMIHVSYQAEGHVA
jgi:hypothetical protein